MASWEFATAKSIVFGAGSAQEAARTALTFGRSVLVVTGRDAGRAAWLLADLERLGARCTRIGVAGEPDVAWVTEGARVARSGQVDVVIALGGGSALDGGKAIAALASNPGDATDYLEVVGKGQPLSHPSLPFIAIPTTAGTGSEVTRNAVLTVPEQHVKVSLRSPLMLPRVAIVDPLLTCDLPPAVTASTGLDALTQLIEPYLSVRATPMTDAICREAIPRAARSLLRTVLQGSDVAAREDMAFASLCGGLALANAGLGAVHGFAAPIGGMFGAQHGAVCAALLPAVMAANVRALDARAPGSAARHRADDVGRLLTGRADATAADAVAWLEDTVRAVGIKPLGRYGIARADIPGIVDQARRASSMKGNPIELTVEELAEILAVAI